MRKKVQRKEKGETIDNRISVFIEKLTVIGDNSQKIAGAVRNELRWLGLEGSEKYAIGTVRSYLSRYRDSVAQSLPFNSKAKEAIEAISKKHGGILDSILNNWVNPYNVIRQIKSFLADLQNKTDGLFDALIKVRIAHPAYYLLKVKPGQAATLKDSYRTAINHKKRNNIEIARSAVEQAVKDGLTSGTKNGMLVALSLCSGRRPIELYKTGSFDVNKKNGCLMFFGQAKLKHGRTGEGYEIPVLHVRASQFVQLFKKFRAMINTCGKQGKMQYKGADQLTNAQINARISQASETARRMLLNTSATLYLCRSIYAHMVVEQQPERDRDTVMADVLGHSEKDTVTAQSYQGVTLTDQPLSEAFKQYQASLSDTREVVTAVGRTNKKPKKSKAKKSAMVEKLARLASDDRIAKRKALVKINDYVMQAINDNPTVTVTRSSVSKALGSNRKAINDYFGLVEETYGRMLEKPGND